ncbi:MAG: hypothetical protein EOO00_05695, partial [Chitinophagaceae bacterium]
MDRLFALFCIVLFCKSSVANEHWYYSTTRNGITLNAVGGWEDTTGWKNMYNAFLDLIHEKTKNSRGDLKILLVLDQAYLPMSDNWQALIAYDTLRELDQSFLYAYYDYYLKESYSSDTIPDYYKFPTLRPLDVNATFQPTSTELGLKIVYDYGADDSLTFFDRIFSLTTYGCEHINDIKENQKK